MQDKREEQVRERAHRLWEADGRPEGRDREHWAQAEKELLGSEGEAGDLSNNPGISQSAGATGADLDDIQGESTVEGDVLNDTTAAGGVNPRQRGRVNK